MKHLIFILFVLCTAKIYAQQSRADVIEKMQVLSEQMQKSTNGNSGKITYTVNGKTYTETTEISTMIIDGKIGDISNANHTVSIGDGEPHAFKKGQSYVCKGLSVMVNGVQYFRMSKDNVATITYYDGKTVKGKFSGTVYNEKTQKTLPVSGTFETNNVTVL